MLARQLDPVQKGQGLDVELKTPPPGFPSGLPSAAPRWSERLGNSIWLVLLVLAGLGVSSFGQGGPPEGRGRRKSMNDSMREKASERMDKAGEEAREARDEGAEKAEGRRGEAAERADQAQDMREDARNRPEEARGKGNQRGGQAGRPKEASRNFQRAMQKVEQKHLERIARLEVIRDRLREKGNEEAASRAEALIERQKSQQ